MTSSTRTLKSRLVHQLGILVALLIATQAFAATSVDQMLRAGGYDRQLQASYAGVPEQFALNFQQSSGLALGQDIKELVEKSLSSKAIYEYTVNSLEAKLSATQIDTTMAWLNSSLGRKITELEVSASHADEMEKIAAQMNSILSDESKMKRGLEVDALLEATDQSMAQIEMLQLATLTGMVGDRVTAEQFSAMKAQMTEAMQQAQPQIKQTTQAMVAYTYGSISDREYEEFLDYLKTPTSKALHKYITDAHTEVAQTQFESLGRNISAYLEKTQSKQ